MKEEITKNKQAGRRSKKSLTKKEAIHKANKDFRLFARDLVKNMNAKQDKK